MNFLGHLESSLLYVFFFFLKVSSPWPVSPSVECLYLADHHLYLHVKGYSGNSCRECPRCLNSRRAGWLCTQGESSCLACARPPVLSQNQGTINILHSLSASITQYLRPKLLKEAILLTRGFRSSVYADRVAFRSVI